MPNIHIRNIPDDIYIAIKERAEDAGRSVSAQIRYILGESVLYKRSLNEVARAVEEIRKTYSPDRGSRRDLDRYLNEERDR